MKLESFTIKRRPMSKKKKTDDPAEIPTPGPGPEIKPDRTPHEPELPGEKPEISPGTEPEIRPDITPDKPSRPEIE